MVNLADTNTVNGTSLTGHSLHNIFKQIKELLHKALLDRKNISTDFIARYHKSNCDCYTAINKSKCQDLHIKRSVS